MLTVLDHELFRAMASCSCPKRDGPRMTPTQTLRPVAFCAAMGQIVAASNFVEAAAMSREASRDAKRIDHTVLLDWSHTGSVGLDAARNLDLPC